MPLRGSWLDRPVRIELPRRIGARLDGREFTVAVSGWRRPARALAVGLPLLMVASGFLLAVGSAIAAERDGTEGIGTLGTEAGAALWFGGAVVLGVSRTPTVLRALLLATTAMAGVATVALALTLGWSGAALALAMEFGVGAIAVAVIDVVLLGIIHPRIAGLADAPERATVTVRLGSSWHLIDVTMRTEAAGPAPRS